MVAFEGFEKKNFSTSSEEGIKSETEKQYQPLQRSLLGNSGANQTDKLFSSHYSSPKSFLNTSNDRQTFSAAFGRKYENSSNNSFDNTASSHFEKQWRGY